VAAVGDVRRYQISKWICLGLVALYPLFVLARAEPVAWSYGLGTGAAVFVVGFALFRLGLMGGGDGKLLAAVALWAGPGQILPVLLVIALAGGVIAITLGLTRLVHGRVRAATSPAVVSAGILGGRLPYGVAIACGGFYLAARWFGV
jgi:prepilin peptidase CpaA